MTESSKDISQLLFNIASRLVFSRQFREQIAEIIIEDTVLVAKLQGLLQIMEARKANAAGFKQVANDN